MTSLLADTRVNYHRELAAKVLGYRANGIVTNADAGSESSRIISGLLARILERRLNIQLPRLEVAGQELGNRFAQLTAKFVENSFRLLEHARPGPWCFTLSQASPGIARYEPYTHLAQFQRFIDELRKINPEAAVLLDFDYVIKPDIVVYRKPWTDQQINEKEPIVSQDDGVATLTPFRKRRKDQPGILHASISCKWTIRSDRAQNARTEALNLIRLRKGRAPHIVVVTGEPLPSRLASLGFGTGDIDCVYHFALYELQEAVAEAANNDQLEIFQQLVSGNRLRDISDLPLDLAI